MASSAKVEFRAAAPGPENNGAGGNGRLGLPPYRLEGVPGLGAPLSSGGSKLTTDGGGLLKSTDPRVSHDRVGDDRPVGEYELYEDSGAPIDGALSIIEGALECDDMTVGW